LFRLLHWVLSVVILLLMATGLSLHAAARPEWSVFSGVVPSWLWEGRVFLWHLCAAIVYAPSILAVLVVLRKSRLFRRPTQAMFLGSGIVTIITGLLMMYPVAPVALLKVAVALHFASGLIMMPLAFIWHVVAGLIKFFPMLVPSFRPFHTPQWRHLGGFAVLGVVTTWIILGCWPIGASLHKLPAHRISQSEAAVTDMAALPWDKATPLSIRLVNGKGFDSGQTNMTLSALHDGDQLYVKAEWEDPKADFGYWPWRKTDDGWEYLQTSKKDETVHYEDKFSLIFPMAPSWQFEQVGCAVYCHVDGDYGWGYKGGLPQVDVWHWKSARTSSVGQVDDKYWSEVDLEAKDVGRHSDHSEGGGFAKNLAEDTPHPAFLPDTPEAVHRGMIPKEHAVPYSEEAAKQIPPETIIPGLVCEPFQGDRGDVSSVSTHQNGRWTLYVRRKLDTGSEHDVKFAPGGTYSFGAAAFDCAAKRHAYSMPVLHLSVEE